jgi:arginase
VRNMSKVALTAFQARAGDHNNLAIPGARSIGSALSKRLSLPCNFIGIPEPALDSDWKTELTLALPTMRAMAKCYEKLFEQGDRPVSATSRCAVSLATLPVVVKYFPDVCVLWYDSHADLNTPETTDTEYLGGLALAGAAGLWDSGLGGGLSLANIILVGQRDLDRSEQAQIDTGKVLHIAADGDLPSELRLAIAGRQCYVHLDCDVLNPGIVPTDYVHEGGLSLEKLHDSFVEVAKSEVIGLEIAEFQNAWTDGGEPVSPDGLLDALQPLLSRIGQGIH